MEGTKYGEIVFEIDDETLNRLRLKASLLHMSLNDYVELLFREELEKEGM